MPEPDNSSVRHYHKWKLIIGAVGILLSVSSISIPLLIQYIGKLKSKKRIVAGSAGQSTVVPEIIKKIPYLINDIDCWGKCKLTGKSCPEFCGVNGYCCRKGYNGCIKIYRDVASSDHHKCVRGNPPPPVVPEIIKKIPYLINDIDCWGKCKLTGKSCPEFCGVNGYCCRKGYNGCIKIYRDVASSDHHKCVRGNPPPPGIVKKIPYLINHLDCWGKCQSKGGSCPSFCGVDGYCCRKGYNDCIKIYQDVATSNHHKCVRGNPAGH